MTLIVGLKCEQGLILASDSQMSSGPTRRPGRKVFISGDRDLAFALAGNESTMYLLGHALSSLSLAGRDEHEAREALADCAADVFATEFNRIRGVLALPLDQMPLAEAIVAAYVEDVPTLFHIEASSAVTNHPGQLLAAGWGSAFAQHAYTVFRELGEGGLTVHQAKMLAYRVVEDAIEIAGPATMLGGPIQMASLTLESGLSTGVLSSPDDPVIKEAVDNWVAIEAERFRDHRPPG